MTVELDKTEPCALLPDHQRCPLRHELIAHSAALDAAHQGLRSVNTVIGELHDALHKQRESLEFILGLVNNHDYDLKEFRNSNISSLSRMDKVEAALNETVRTMHEIRSFLGGVNREQETMSIQVVKTESISRDTNEKLTSHILDESIKFERYNKTLIKMTSALVAVIVLAHGAAMIMNDTPAYEKIVGLLELVTGGK